MSSDRQVSTAPGTPRGVGARVRITAALWSVGCCLLVLPSEGAAQVEPDSIPRPDSLALDTLGLALDTLPAEQEGDSVSADTIFYNLPRLDGEVPAGWKQGVWTWEHDDIMATGAVSLAELLAEVPGIITLLGGDYGTPAALSSFGSGGGGFRVIRDGFEVLPLTGGVPDLQRIGLGGIHHVRLERNGGEMVIHLRSLEFDDGRPYSLVEASTGDLDTNTFRGAFADPVALGEASPSPSSERIRRVPGANRPATGRACGFGTSSIEATNRGFRWTSAAWEARPTCPST